MVNFQKGELLKGFLLKLGRSIVTEEETTELPEENETIQSKEAEADPMKVYWESDKTELDKKNQPFIDLFMKDVAALQRIPDTTAKPIVESHYDLEGLSQVFLPGLKNLNENIKQSLNIKSAGSGVTEGVPNTGTGISSSGRDAGVVAGIVVAVISGVIILAALIAVVMYRHYVHRNVTSMNFDNPVYRKTTEDQFALEKNGYAPGSKLYPSTVGEEAQQPLNTPGTNDFV